MTKMAVYLNNTLLEPYSLIRCLGTAPRRRSRRLPLYISPTVPHRNAATRAFQVVVIGIRMMIGIRIIIIEISFTYRFVKRKKIILLII